MKPKLIGNEKSLPGTAETFVNSLNLNRREEIQCIKSQRKKIFEEHKREEVPSQLEKIAEPEIKNEPKPPSEKTQKPLTEETTNQDKKDCLYRAPNDQKDLAWFLSVRGKLAKIRMFSVGIMGLRSLIVS